MKDILSSFWKYIERRRISLFDAFEFGFVRLSKNFFLWFACLLILSLTTILFPRDYGCLVEYGPLIAVFIFCLQWLYRRSGVGKINSYQFEKDDGFIRSIGDILPSAIETKFYFSTVKSQYAPDGPVTISDKFNVDCISNPDWDCKIIIRKSKDRYISIVDELRRNAIF